MSFKPNSNLSLNYLNNVTKKTSPTNVPSTSIFRDAASAIVNHRLVRGRVVFKMKKR